MKIEFKAWFPGLLLGTLLAAAQAQSAGRIYIAQDYARAERFLSSSVDPLVFHTVDHATWLSDDRLWYRDAGPEGVTFTLVDPQTQSVAPAFDHEATARALTDAVRSGALSISQATPLDPHHLPIDDLSFSPDGRAVFFTIAGQHVRCKFGRKTSCESADPLHGHPLSVPYELSPDGTRAVFVRQNNLWMRELASGRDTQLTFDGIQGFGYATDNAGWRRSANPIVVWSPDSKKIATFQYDLRPSGRMALTGTAIGHPAIDVWRYPLAGERDLPKLYPVVLDLDAHGGAKMIRLAMTPMLHRSSLCDDLSCNYGHGWDDVQWAADSASIAILSTSRDHKQETLQIADAADGHVRSVMSETSAFPLESGETKVCWRYLSRSNEILWWSERDDWGQLYLYDATTGKLKNQVTHGLGDVTELLDVDEPSHTILFVAVGRQPSWDPYFRGAYRVNYDGSGLQLLTPSVADHAVTSSPDGRFLLDVASTPTAPQISAVDDAQGREVVALPRQNISKLREAGWQPPTPFTVKARDGKTDLYGFLFQPTDLDPAVRYPIVDYVYPGPQIGSCGTRSFAPGLHGLQALAELGFVVVCIDGTGTPFRSASFHNAHYGDMGDNTIPDQVAGIRQLAARFPWIDLDRVGVYGHSGGGAATAAAMFHFPEFFKVGVSESGNHDNRDYEDDWGEKWQGLLVQRPDGTTNYDNQANELDAHNLRGHLLLMHGTMDDNVPPENTMLVVRALIEANKDFDLLMIPNAGHAYGASAPYALRRRWDYFVRYLAGGTPPSEYRMRPFSER